MRPETHRRALAATAKIACTAALVGCAGDRPPPHPATPSEVRPPAIEPAAVDVPETSAPLVSSAPPPPAQDLEACRQSVADAFPDGGTQRNPADVPDRLKQCCARIAAAEDAPETFGQGWKERNACCSALDWSGSITCTPWGPPMPPAFLA